jgi:preprotein translocase subunit SecE
MKISEYIKETKGEMKHVTWPSKKQAINYSALVVGVSVVTALVLAIIDRIFNLGLGSIIGN